MLRVTERSIVAPECGVPMKGRLHGSLSSGTTCETRVSGADAGAIRASQAGGQGLAPGRNLHADRLSPKAVIRLLGRPAATRPRRPRGRQLAYGPEVVVALRAIWIAAGHPWAGRVYGLR